MSGLRVPMTGAAHTALGVIMLELTKILGEEHAAIRQAAACLMEVARRASETGELEARAAVELVEFFEDFADGTHQEKEERCLFPALLATGIANERVGELLGDHEQERSLLGGLRAELEGAAYGEPLALDAFVARANAYAELQSAHATSEDELLVPLVQELLTPAEQRSVLAGFAAVEARTLQRPAALHMARLARIARELGSILDAPARSAAELRGRRASATQCGPRLVRGGRGTVVHGGRSPIAPPQTP